LGHNWIHRYWVLGFNLNSKAHNIQFVKRKEHTGKSCGKKRLQRRKLDYNSE